MTNAQQNAEILNTAAARIVKQMTLLGSDAASEAMPPVTGKVGAMMDLNPREIEIDRTYQRDPIQKSVRLIALHWNWRVYQPISVSMRPDGSLWCYDGQHRLLAAQMRCDIETIPCWVVEADGAQVEARDWLELNENRKRIKSMERFTASAVAKDPSHEWLSNVLKERGLTPTIRTVNMQPGDFNAISVCLGVLNKRDKIAAKRHITDAFDVIDAAWHGQPRAYSGRNVAAVLRLVSSVTPEMRRTLKELAAARLGRYTAQEVLTDLDNYAKVAGKAFLSGAGAFLADRFNYRQRNNLLTLSSIGK